jgi:hypothetical protein
MKPAPPVTSAFPAKAFTVRQSLSVSELFGVIFYGSALRC